MGGKLLLWVVGSVPKEKQFPTYPILSYIVLLEGSNQCQELALTIGKKEKGISAYSSPTFAPIAYPKGEWPHCLTPEPVCPVSTAVRGGGVFSAVVAYPLCDSRGYSAMEMLHHTGPAGQGGPCQEHCWCAGLS